MKMARKTFARLGIILGLRIIFFVSIIFGIITSDTDSSYDLVMHILIGTALILLFECIYYKTRKEVLHLETQNKEIISTGNFLRTSFLIVLKVIFILSGLILFYKTIIELILHEKSYFRFDLFLYLGIFGMIGIIFENTYYRIKRKIHDQDLFVINREKELTELAAKSKKRNKK